MSVRDVREWLAEGPRRLRQAMKPVQSDLAGVYETASQWVVLAGAWCAFLCFGWALKIAQPNGFAELSGRYLLLTGIPLSINIPDVAAWPLQFAYLITRPMSGLATDRAHAIEMALAGAAILIVVNVLLWVRQTDTRSIKFAVTLWVASIAASAFDLLRDATLPVGWDSVPLIGGLSNGEVLRGIEVIASIYLLSFALVIRISRVRPDVVRPWGQISGSVKRGLIIRGALLVMTLPFLIQVGSMLAHRIGNSPSWFTTTATLIEGSVVLLLAWAVFVRSLCTHIASLGRYGWQIMSTRPPLRETLDPASLGSRGRVR